MISEITRGWSGNGKGAGELTPNEIEQLWTRAVCWIVRRANELCPDGRPTRHALAQACNESRLLISEEQQKSIFDAEMRLREEPGLPIVVSSERELEDEIEKAKTRGEFIQAKRSK